MKDIGIPLQSYEITQFRSLVGCLRYLTFTRHDITYGVNSVCQFLNSPTHVHLQAAQRILSYIKGSISQGVFFRRGVGTDTKTLSRSSLDLKVYCDAD